MSGVPLVVNDGGKDISLSGQDQDRPNVILPNSVIPATRTIQEWFNPAAIAIQPTGTFGNLGRECSMVPGQINLDIALSRQFAIRERLKMEFRSDFFNIMNHGNWSGVGSSTASPATFGTITSFTIAALHPDGVEAVLLKYSSVVSCQSSVTDN